MDQFKLGDITVDVWQKDIKNIHLSVYPPTGTVRISAPLRMDLDTIRVYTISKLSWIKRQQKKFKAQKREAPREFIGQESHYFQGKRYLLKVVEGPAPSQVVLKHRKINLHVKPGATLSDKRLLLEAWYREQLKQASRKLISKWEKNMDLHVDAFFVRKMKTKWGSCKIESKHIWLNLELAKKPLPCLEYIIVHEMTHLLERNHNGRFLVLMDSFLPNWRTLKEELNELPI